MVFLPSETVADSSPTPRNDNQDTLSGAGGFDVTTKVPFLDPTENFFTLDYEDGTHSITLDEEEGKVIPLIYHWKAHTKDIFYRFVF